MSIPESQIADLKIWVESAGAEWCGVQQPLTPGMQHQLLFTSRRTGSTYQVPIDGYLSGKIAGDSIAHRVEKRLKEKDKDFQEKNMNLKEKLHTVYTSLSAIEKKGENTSQHYNYIKAVDVVREIRDQLIAIRVYAEVNFDFAGSAYTIARAKDLNAPFTARDCRCTIVFHDLETGETLTGSGLGTGADTGDKAIYKAQTGAFKYALKNAFLVPDEEAPDAEGDKTIDENAEPDFNNAKAAPRKTTQKEQPAPKQEATKPPKANIPEWVPAKADSGTAIPVSAPQAPPTIPISAQTAAANATPTASVTEAATDTNIDGLPNDEEMNEYRKRYRKVGDELSEGFLKSSKSLPVGRKLLVFMLQKSDIKKADEMTKRQWIDFFARVEAAKNNPEVGYAGLATLINRANGIEDKK